MSAIEEVVSPVLSNAIATLKAAVADQGEELVLAALAEGGVFLPRHLLYKQLREAEGLLEAERFAHANTGEELDRTQQLLAAEREARLDLQAQLQTLKGDFTPQADIQPAETVPAMLDTGQSSLMRHILAGPVG